MQAQRRRVREPCAQLLECVLKWDAMSSMLANSFLLLVNQGLQESQLAGGDWGALSSNQLLMSALRRKQATDLEACKQALTKYCADLDNLLGRMRGHLDTLLMVYIDVANANPQQVFEVVVLKTITLARAVSLCEAVCDAYARQLITLQGLTQYALTSIFNKVLDLVSLQPVVSQPDVKDSIAILRLEIED